MKRSLASALFVLILSAAPALARVNLMTVPRREGVQLTIYNSADITLVRERRTLTLARGTNQLEFSWVGTLIDPTSVEFRAVTHAEKIDVVDVTFPGEAPNLLVWAVESDIAGPVEVEITYFTSGITWAADYEMTLAPDLAKMDLASFVKVTNRSGEEYGGAEVRLVVGTIQLVEDIGDLARRGVRPIPYDVQASMRLSVSRAAPAPASAGYMAYDGVMMEYAAPEIVREGLSEYFLYTVSGRQEIPDGWGVRWRMFRVGDIPVESLYRQEDGRYPSPRRFVYLANDRTHRLGEEPLPDGDVRVFQKRPEGGLRFAGRSLSKYIPMNEDWEIDLGEDPEVSVRATRLDFRVENPVYDESRRTVDGWDVVEEWKIETTNSRETPVRVEVDRNFAGDFDYVSSQTSEKYDIDTVRLARRLAPREKDETHYTVTYHRGSRARR